MRRYGRIAMSLWHSQKFRALGADDRARLLYFYFHTCPQANSVGCFAIPIGYPVADLRWGEAEVRKAINRLSAAYLIACNEAEQLIRIVDFIAHDPPTNEKHGMALVSVAIALPDCREKLSVYRDLLAIRHCAGNKHLHAEHDRLSEAYRDPTETHIPLPLPLPLPVTSSLRSEVTARFALPDWVPKEAWDGFVEMRKRIRAPLTTRALTLQVRRLEQLMSEGQDPVAVLDQSTGQSWRGLFPLKAQPNGSGLIDLSKV